MGTTQSSNGPGGGVPLVPPWVPELDDPTSSFPDKPETQNPDPVEEDEPTSLSQQTPPPSIAPRGRFSGVRRNIGSFAATGGTTAMRRGLQHYVSTGYQGVSNTTKRHGGTIRTAADLYRTLTPPAEGQQEILDTTLLEGKSAEDVMDAVVEATRPVDGTQDAESSRASIKEALADLLSRFPTADLLELTEEQRLFAVQRYVSWEVYRRFVLDLGSTIKEKAANPTIALQRLREIRDYIWETASASFRKIRGSNGQLDPRSVKGLVRAALEETFQVFQTYSE